jgi:hypothetical protein
VIQIDQVHEKGTRRNFWGIYYFPVHQIELGGTKLRSRLNKSVKIGPGGDKIGIQFH